MDRCQAFDGLHFDDEFRVDNKIHSESPRKGRAVEDDREKLLPFDWQTEASQSIRKKRLVNRLQKAWTKLLMQAQAGIDG